MFVIMRSRRNFIRTNLMGGMFFIGGLPLLSFNASKNREEVFSGTRLKKLLDQGNWSQIRDLFPLTKDKHYFNTASLGPVSEPVVESVIRETKSLAENGRDGRWHFKRVREQLSKFTNAHPDLLAFTRNCTEGMNIAANTIPFKRGDEIIITNQEHVGGASPFLALQRSKGVTIKVVKLQTNGQNVLSSLQDAVTERTKMLVCSHVCCTNGMILPAAEIVKMCRNRGIFSCIDGAQALGMIPIDLESIDPDFYTASGHKWLYGPFGSGMIYIGRDILENYEPPYVGAYSDSSFDLTNKTIEFRKVAAREEYGSRNPAQIVGMGKAIEFISEIGFEKLSARSNELRERLRESITEIPSIQLLSPIQKELSTAILSFRCEKQSNEELVRELRSEYRIICRYIYEADLDAIRISLPIFTSDEELDNLVVVLKKLINN